MAAFTPGNIVVYRVGTGAAALNATATAVFLDEYTPAGVFVQSIPLPTADSGGNQMLTASGSATSEGLLTLSTDGRYLILTGYDAAVGTAAIAGTASSANARVIGRVGADRLIDTSTALVTNGFSGGNIRGAASTDGQTFWATGSNTGVVTATLGATSGTVVSSTATNLRAVEIFDGQLYVSANTGTLRLGTVGSGTPTTGGQTITNLSGFPTTALSPYQFYFADLTAAVPGVDTLYVTDDRAAASGGGITKYSLVGANWVSNGTAANSLRGLTGDTSGTTVSLYATTTAAANSIVSLIDTGGYNAAFSTTTYTTLVTTATNTAFRGIAFVPTAPVGAETQTVQFNPISVTQAEGNSGTTAFTFTITRTGGTLGQLDFSGTIAAGSTDNADFVGGTAPTSFSGSIPAGQASATVTVNVQGDFTIEGDESFTLTITTATNTDGTVTVVIGANDDATGNITNDNFPGAISVADVALAEGDAGTTPGNFTLTRTGGATGTVSVDYVITLPGGVGGADSSDVSATLTGTVTIIFILADDSGLGEYGCYGGTALPTPNVDRLAADDLHQCLQRQRGLRADAQRRDDRPASGPHAAPRQSERIGLLSLPDETVTVAEVLRGAGYATGGFGEWGLGNEGTTGAAEKQGFDLFYGYYDQVHAHSFFPDDLTRRRPHVPAGVVEGVWRRARRAQYHVANAGKLRAIIGVSDCQGPCSGRRRPTSTRTSSL